MPLDFDLNNFIEDMRACKPPYKCPYSNCGRVYKTFSGIHGHITQGHAADEAGGDGCNGDAGGPALPSSPAPFFRSPVKESLVYNEAQKRLEFEAEGRSHALSLYDALECVAKEGWEATLPKDRGPKEGAEGEEAVTPSAATPTTPATPKSGPGRFGKKKKSMKGATPSSKPSSKPSSDAEAAREEAERQKPLKLPEAHFCVIDDYDVEDAPPLTKAYYRFIEKSQEELDEEVEYDMDEEDVAWLDLMNERRSRDGLAKVEEAQFELLMDRLEKESYFHVQTNGGGGKDYSSAPVDDDAICCVCMDGECSNTNVILFCDLCNLAVHQECYGVPYIPEGQWLCRRCLQSPSRSVECCLCPNKGGAFKRTDDGRWAHVVCGLWIPEVRFANTVFLEPIDSIDNIPPARWKLSCRVCKQRGVGACIQCHKTNCYTAFHVTCGLLAGLHMKMDTVRESSASGGLSVTVRKTAFCDVHTPQDSDCKPKLDDVASLGISTPKQKSSKSSGASGAASSKNKVPDASPVPVLFRGLMNFSPQCPWEKVQEIASLVNVQKRNQFFQRLMAYWTLKRQTRNGVPLIRRLQFAKAMRPDRAPETPQKNAHHSKKKRDAEKAMARKAKEDFRVMVDQRKTLRRLRQDLERVRLLCELIRKREQRKREIVATDAEIASVRCCPFAVFLRNVLDSLRAVDAQEIFAEPVSLDDVPDYLEHIKAPMDFATMSQKLDAFRYDTFASFESDFNLMVDNCMSYNERDTIFFRAGVKMRDVGGSIMRQARRQIDLIGFDPSTMLHTAERVKQVEDVSDDQLMREIDAFMNSEEREEAGASESHLRKLLDMQDKASLLHHPVAKVKRLRLIRQEITKVRRKLSMDKAGTSNGPKKHLAAAADGGGGGGDEQQQPGKKGRKKNREVSPVHIDEEEEDVASPAGRRLRPGKEGATPTPGKRGRKRQRAPSTESGEAAENSSGNKRAKGEDGGPKTPLKSAVASSSPAKSPAGVNRRNAVLFTRKKQAAAKEPEGGETGDDTAAAGKSPAKVTSRAASDASTAADKRRSRDAAPESADAGVDLEMQETELQSPAPEEQTVLRSESPPQPPSADAADKKKVKKKRGRKPKNSGPSVGNDDDDGKGKSTSSPKSLFNSPAAGGSASSEAWRPRASDPSSFQQYRRGAGDMGETDDDFLSESATDAIGTSEDNDTAGDSDSDDSEMNTASGSALNIPLEPLDLVWAKCRGYPWYPALIINPKMPRTGYLHNGVPIPVPPQDVLDMANTHVSPHYLILFFDAKRTWQWLQRDKLEPLGVDSELDKAKLVQSKKPAERKAVKKAYEDAILHRCRVTGENASVSEENTSAADDDDEEEEEDDD